MLKTVCIFHIDRVRLARTKIILWFTRWRFCSPAGSGIPQDPYLPAGFQQHHLCAVALPPHTGLPRPPHWGPIAPAERGGIHSGQEGPTLGVLFRNCANGHPLRGNAPSHMHPRRFWLTDHWCYKVGKTSSVEIVQRRAMLSDLQQCFPVVFDSSFQKDKHLMLWPSACIWVEYAYLLVIEI